VGVVHVIERLNFHQGHLPLRNALLQFIGAALCIVTGHSVGREGPSIHLGATTASLVGQRLALPNNSIRTLVGCGVAAAIAAGFNTPLAGVIFAMEVVLMEYTIIGFAPIILAAVSATALTRLVYGDDNLLLVPAVDWNSVTELPYVLATGLLVGALAAAFIHLLMRTSRQLPDLPVWSRMTLAGIFIGILAVPVPEVMGIGYDTMNDAMLGELGLAFLAVMVVAKLLATAVGIGFGLPGGLIAPTLVMGAGAGGLAGLTALLLFGRAFDQGFYAMLGMAAMMAATLQAPLAALIALLELTANPNILMPGMIAVIAAMLVSRGVFRKPSVYQLLMRARGLDYRNDPVAQTLRRIGVASVMDRNIVRMNRTVSRDSAAAMLRKEPHWVLIRDEHSVLALLPAADLALYLEGTTTEESDVDLMAIPARRQDLLQTTILASLQDALEALERTGKEALFVTGAGTPGPEKVYGVLTRADVEKAYRP
jgi:H+/Cl- antiporter ClcA